jgi:hypothetical protein
MLLADILEQLKIAFAALGQMDVRAGYTMSQEEVDLARSIVSHICTLYAVTVDTTRPVIETLTTFDGLDTEVKTILGIEDSKTFS